MDCPVCGKGFAAGTKSLRTGETQVHWACLGLMRPGPTEPDVWGDPELFGHP